MSETASPPWMRLEASDFERYFATQTPHQLFEKLKESVSQHFMLTGAFAMHFLAGQRPTLDRLATTLSARGALTLVEFDAIVGGGERGEEVECPDGPEAHVRRLPRTLHLHR